jgi:hypothetical protein
MAIRNSMKRVREDCSCFLYISALIPTREQQQQRSRCFPTMMQVEFGCSATPTKQEGNALEFIPPTSYLLRPAGDLESGTCVTDHVLDVTLKRDVSVLMRSCLHMYNMLEEGLNYMDDPQQSIQDVQLTLRELHNLTAHAWSSPVMLANSHSIQMMREPLHLLRTTLQALMAEMTPHPARQQPVMMRRSTSSRRAGGASHRCDQPTQDDGAGEEEEEDGALADSMVMMMMSGHAYSTTLGNKLMRGDCLEEEKQEEEEQEETDGANSSMDVENYCEEESAQDQHRGASCSEEQI